MCGVKRGGAHTCLLLGKGCFLWEGAARDAEGSYTLCDFLRAARRATCGDGRRARRRTTRERAAVEFLYAKATKSKCTRHSLDLHTLRHSTSTKGSARKKKRGPRRMHERRPPSTNRTTQEGNTHKRGDTGRGDGLFAALTLDEEAQARRGRRSPHARRT